MSNAVAERTAPVAAKPRVTVEQYVGEVLPAQKREDLYRSLPAHIKPAVFERNLANAIMINPALMGYHPSLVFREVSKAAALGLFLDPALGEAYIIEAYNYKTRNKEPQLRIGYRGMMKLVKQTGNVEKIYCREVCANDEFVPEMGTEERIIHRPVLFGDRGPVIGYYAVVKFKDGGFDFEPMSIDQIHRIRDRSDGWKAFKEKKISSTPWSTDEDEMAKKTTIRRLVKRQTVSAEVADAIAIEDQAEHSDNPRYALASPPTTRAIAPPPPEDSIKTQTILPAASQAEDGTVTSQDGNPSSDSSEQETDWESLLGMFEQGLAQQNDREKIAELYEQFLELDQMPRDIADRAEVIRDNRIAEMHAEYERQQAAAAEKETKKRTTKPRAAQRGAEAGGDGASEAAPVDPPSSPAPVAPPPPADDDFPGDRPTQTKAPMPPADNMPTPHERDMALAAQRDPAAIVRETARMKAQKGRKSFDLWYKSLSDADANIVDKMEDMNELITTAEAADRAKGEG